MKAHAHTRTARTVIEEDGVGEDVPRWDAELLLDGVDQLAEAAGDQKDRHAAALQRCHQFAAAVEQRVRPETMKMTVLMDVAGEEGGPYAGRQHGRALHEEVAHLPSRGSDDVQSRT